ncbi:CRP-like cAMP-binding protein [Chryseobacterium shigense]|uniref:CRP-like cAMP-binding protein n=2 Tax=Chryseobacterium shigense TaxID=297244 RepID=A0A841NGK8_9FLAO|nr:CRP-like cAMP-binding protein [Chryseobacterium shigense]
MVIDEELLLSSGAELMNYSINDIIFKENDQPKYYFQIRTGTVKINNYHEDGREIIHSLPFDGHCFAESSLFIDKPYPVNAVAMGNCEIIRLDKNKFLELTGSSPDLILKLYSYTAERMYYRHVMLSNISAPDPGTKVKRVMDCFKSYNQYTDKYSYQFPFTRQHLASLTGLCVETVIRVVKKMEKEKTVRIQNGKIFY